MEFIMTETMSRQTPNNNYTLEVKKNTTRNRNNTEHLLAKLLSIKSTIGNNNFQKFSKSLFFIFICKINLTINLTL